MRSRLLVLLATFVMALGLAFAVLAPPVLAEDGDDGGSESTPTESPPSGVNEAGVAGPMSDAAKGAGFGAVAGYASQSGSSASPAGDPPSDGGPIDQGDGIDDVGLADDDSGVSEGADHGDGGGDTSGGDTGGGDGTE
jgi:hypothetical protein